MPEPSELLAAALASMGLFLAIVASGVVVVLLTALAGIWLAAAALDARHRRQPRSYHRANTTSLAGDLRSP
ncbi:MAG: hypothetical protein ACRDGL_10915 [Candidatus Limnocylindrales bacterium]